MLQMMLALEGPRATAPSEPAAVAATTAAANAENMAPPTPTAAGGKTVASAITPRQRARLHL
jgi:hypothetical protein